MAVLFERSRSSEKSDVIVYRNTSPLQEVHCLSLSLPPTISLSISLTSFLSLHLHLLHYLSLPPSSYPSLPPSPSLPFSPSIFISLTSCISLTHFLSLHLHLPHSLRHIIYTYIRIRQQKVEFSSTSECKLYLARMTSSSDSLEE